MTARSPVPRGHLATPSAEDLRARYESGASVSDLVLSTKLSHGTVINRLRAAGTRMRTSQETRKMRAGKRAKARIRLARELRSLYEKGATIADLADRCGRSAKTARRLLAEAGGSTRTSWQTRRMRRTRKEVAERQLLLIILRSRYETGETVTTLATDHGLSTSTIYRLLKQAKTTMRRPGRIASRGVNHKT